MTTKAITSVSDLIGELRAITVPNCGPQWFRGHANADWKLQPNYDRLKKPVGEIELLGRFRQNANLLLEKAPAMPYDFGWMFLMQHYGVPTRLLDWTENPLIALYFAVEDKKSKKDGALWVLFPHELNKLSTESRVYIPSFEDDWLANYSVISYSKGKDNGILPIAVIATRNNPRIQAQLGVFTISHLKKTPIEEIDSKSHCLKFTIPSKNKNNIREELKILGINRFQVFPELSSIGQELKDTLK
ncbi:FRG domain-containing protein [Duganella sp. FT109W]|uniref:FRG domain-containing protein n=1 Tax=Duganella margarita TaxID=2692170 RepID=A0ABW9WPH5_9BURK|nr:FRG domain-containing protein [Duganella margarita]MYN42863.1 FRG domain-containing protein [Duganella margarita]